MDQSILPNFDVFANAAVPPRAMTQAAAGMGRSGLGKNRLFALSPVLATMGLGDDATVPAVVGAPAATQVTAGHAAVGVLILAAVGALGYQAGKAMAPSSSDKTTWGWIGVPVTLFTGVLGLGVMGAVANHGRR